MALSKIQTSVITDDAITSSKIVGDAITNSKIADDAVQTENLASTVNLGRRNLIINGAMQVAQRGTSQTNIGNSSGGGYFTLDRFTTAFTTSGIFTMTQSTVTDLPGFANALKLDCTTADTSIAADEYFLVEQKLEGQDLQQLAYNQSSAKTTTVSFYVKGNASAQYTFALQYHLSGGTARWFTKGFAVTTDWARITITIPGDTQSSSGSDYGIADNSSTGANLMIWLHGGTNFSSGTHQDTAWADRDYTKLFQDNQTSFFDSTARTLEITGFQFEVGEQATPFEHRSFGEEQALCQRYFCLYADNNELIGGGGYQSSTFPDVAVSFPVPMRAAPTLVHTSGSNYYGITTHNAAPVYFNEFTVAYNSGLRHKLLYPNSSVSGTQGSYGRFFCHSSGKISFNAEL